MTCAARSACLGLRATPQQAAMLRRAAEVSNKSMVDPGRGVGVGLLQDAIRRTLGVADQAGVRALLTHPIDEAAGCFYVQFGFEASPAPEQQMILLLKDARRLLMPASGKAGETKSGRPNSKERKHGGEGR